MKKGDLNSNIKGFTIIEVALVIAIAGLIFLMVFVALPGLQVSQRDAERREDVTMLLENVKKYQTNNRGALPGLSDNATLDNGGLLLVGIKDVKESGNDANNDAKWVGFYKQYLGENFLDPNGENYTLTIMRCGTEVADASCPGTNLTDISFPNDYQMYIVTQAACNGDQAVGTSNPRKLAVLYKLEGGGLYCANT